MVRLKIVKFGVDNIVYFVSYLFSRKYTIFEV